MGTIVDNVISTLDSDGRKIFMLALLLEAGPLDVGEALLFPVSCPFRSHNLLGVGRRGRGGGAAHVVGCPRLVSGAALLELLDGVSGMLPPCRAEVRLALCSSDGGRCLRVAR